MGGGQDGRDEKDKKVSLLDWPWPGLPGGKSITILCLC